MKLPVTSNYIKRKICVIDLLQEIRTLILHIV